MNMFPNKILSVLCAFFSLQLLGVIAYPMLNIPFLFGSESRYKKNELGFPVARLADEEVPIDGDVLELEHLKHAQTAADNIDSILESVSGDNKKATEKPGHTIAVPELPLGVDAETVVTLPPPTSTTTTTTTTKTTTSKATAVETTKQVTGEIIGGGIHHPPTLSQNEQKSGQQQIVVQETGMSSEDSQGVPSGAKTTKNFLHLDDGQLSPFDMAQYIFLTGDEEGVTQAIEECIEDGILSREQALKLLHDIRVGLEYLQGLPEPRVFPEMLHPNSVKKSFQTLVTTTKKPLNKPMDSIALWNKLQELNVDGKQELNDYDEATGRAKIAEFLYTHYTVEEILYKLAKVMFTQSLAHGSDEAQRELQKLTDFLEREGNSGVIPVDLQKKILHVLLTALSDTLTEHPELLAAAQQNLVNPYDRIPMRTYGRLN